MRFEANGIWGARMPTSKTVATTSRTRIPVMMSRFRLRFSCSSTGRRPGRERHHWLRTGVRRLDCTQGVSSASPVMRANQELTPPSETSERTRT